MRVEIGQTQARCGCWWKPSTLEESLDTKYFEQAVREYGRKLGSVCTVGDLTLGELSRLLRRAQELKDADQQKAILLERKGA